jgi:hypothetical protein
MATSGTGPPVSTGRLAETDSHRCNYPADASKWNLIDHRVFSEIFKIWAVEPLH